MNLNAVLIHMLAVFSICMKNCELKKREHSKSEDNFLGGGGGYFVFPESVFEIFDVLKVHVLNRRYPILRQSV
jgi:hypothetical protein